ncbi:unnamed protein product, partial [Rotaria sp. Silwood2]
RHVVQSLGSSLFQFRYNQENIGFIQICHNFLAGKCNFKTEGCNRLHLCRHFDSCTEKDCHFPHNFTHDNNRRIVEQSNCQNVDPSLLVRLIRLNEQFSNRLSKNFATSSIVSQPADTTSLSVQTKPVQPVFERSKPTRSRRRTRGNASRRVADEHNTTPLVSMSSAPDIDCQINISFLSASIAHYITIEDIVEFLRRQGLPVLTMCKTKEKEYFNQWTLQFQDNNNNLLAIPGILYHGIPLKFKRASSLIDEKGFVLKSTIDSKRGLITIEEFSNYIDVLINQASFKLIDLSSPLEQILLIQCDNNIGMNSL